VRGSTPTPERRNSRYGGNTPCLEVRLANGTLIILDCGSGLRALGKSLLREFGDRPIHAYVFLTHFHWDHIQGIPFFLPLYRKGNSFLFHSVCRKGLELKGAIEGQMVNPYFPVDMSAMGASRHFYDLDERPINLHGALVSSAPLNHPQECVAYRIEADGGVFVLATDTEPGSIIHDRSVRELARGADLFVYDAQYTPEQLRGERKGWGHSSWLEGARIARECGVRRLALFHHDPDNDDAFVDGLVEKARKEFPDVRGASEGMEFTLPEGVVTSADLAESSNRRSELRYPLELPIRVGWRNSNGETREARGVAQDLSRSGIYFVVPEEVSTEQPLELEVLIPDDITHCGPIAFRSLAETLRQERCHGALGVHHPTVGVAARLVLREAGASPQTRKNPTNLS
jgi:phosphoribosyl 1,2-cyclic phosphodiesterase